MTAEPLPAVDDAGEGGNRAAGGCVLAVVLAGAGGVAYAAPEAAYFVTGLLAAAGVRRARAWVAARRAVGEEQDEEPIDIVAALQGLAEGGEHVRLTQLQQAAGLPDTKAVRALLDEAGIPVRPGVRAGGKNGPGVHRDDVPPLPAPASGAPSGGCLCSSAANTNANNVRVDRVGDGAQITVTDLSERRAYKV
ncbi:hypothetical protein [Streptomyces sp. NPDC059949]|uniref:hypothetical protein n=1 Tax=Streptomyces sp. NPDC059949 TaxID=3347013 RepID=UPI003663B90B